MCVNFWLDSVFSNISFWWKVNMVLNLDKVLQFNPLSASVALI